MLQDTILQVALVEDIALSVLAGLCANLVDVLLLWDDDDVGCAAAHHETIAMLVLCERERIRALLRSSHLFIAVFDDGATASNEA